MADIDFDELDKAVNNLMSKASAEKEDTPPPKTLSINSTLQPDEKPEYSKLEKVAEKIGNETLTTDLEQTVDRDHDSSNQNTLTDVAVNEPVLKAHVVPERSTPVPERRASSGRFMDVVHPSSDMRTANSSSISVPTRSEKVEETPEEKPVFSEPIAIDKPVEAVDDSAPLTPFLPNANTKVEKRPLGASLPFSFGKSKDDKEVKDSDAEPDEPVKSEPINAEYEKEHDPLKKEKNGHDQLPIDPTEFISKASAEEQALQEVEAVEIKETPEEKSVRAVESGDTERLSKVTNPDSHEEKTEDTDKKDENGDIYDVNNYHQPLGHPAKHKSGWGTVAIIIVIIIVCIALAGAAYFILGMGV